MEESIYFQAKDLMLGDWIKIGKIPLRVIQLTHFTHKDDSVVLETGSEYLDVEPIPITAEILEKNGFKHRIIDCAEFYYIAEDYYDITISEWSDNIWLVRYDCTEMNTPHEQKICGYVHQLQHFLKECGLTELADNFKV